MLVSVGIPTRNRARYLTESLRSALSQTYSDLEIVVSDNGSTDETREIVGGIGDERVRYFRQPENVGAIPNLDTCLRLASGDLFLLLSDDDLLEPKAIELLSLPFRESGGHVPAGQIGLTWSPCTTIDAEGHPLWLTAPGPRFEQSSAFICSVFSGKRGPRLASVMVRTKDSRYVGGFDGVRYRAFADTTNWSKIALSYPYVACIDRPLVRYRMHAASATSQSLCDDWHRWGSLMLDDLIALLREKNDREGARKLAASRNHLMANLTAEVLMRGKGRPGWIRDLVMETWRSRKIMLTPYVAARIFREGWKLARFR